MLHGRLGMATGVRPFDGLRMSLRATQAQGKALGSPRGVMLRRAVRYEVGARR